METKLETHIASSIKDTLLQNKIIKLDSTEFPNPWSSSQWSEAFGRNDYLINLVFVNNELAGLTLIGLSRLESLGHLYKIVVKNKFRGMSTAQFLFGELSESLRCRNILRIYLEVSVLNTQAIAFYEKQGFENLNRIKNFYSNSEDAFAMQKSL